MYLQSIQSYCGKLNISGNVHLKVVPVQWIATFPEFSTEHAYGDPITLLPGKEWLLLPCVADSINFSDNDNSSIQGSSNQFNLDGFIPNDTPNISAILDSMRGYEWIAVIQYKTGESKVIGHPDAPARCLSEFQNRGQLNSDKGYKVFFVSDYLVKSHFIDTIPAPPQCLPGTGTNSDGSFSLTVPSGTTQPIPDSQINVNSVDIGDVASVKTIDVNVTDGTNPVNPDSVSLVGNTLTVAVPKDLEINIPFLTSDTTASITILTGSDGTITTADTTGLTSVTYEKNAVAATLPITLAVADVLTINFDAAVADGVIKLSGTYA